MGAQKALVIQSNPYKKNNVRNITLPDFKCGAIVTKVAWYRHRRHAGQYKTREGLSINLPNASHLTLEKDIKNGYWKKTAY